MPRVLTGVSAERRSSISRAALFVNVTARTDVGVACPVASSHAMRVVNTRVLPLPAPARISADACGSVTASSCSGLRLARSGEVTSLSIISDGYNPAARGFRYATTRTRRHAAGQLGDDARVRALDPRRR